MGAQTRRTDNVVWHQEDRLEIHPHDAEQRGIKDDQWVRIESRAGETAVRALVTDRVAPGVVYTTFHHPLTQANVITTDFSDWATNCPEYKVTAVQVSPAKGPTQYQEEYEAFYGQKPADPSGAAVHGRGHPALGDEHAGQAGDDGEPDRHVLRAAGGTAGGAADHGAHHELLGSAYAQGDPGARGARRRGASAAHTGGAQKVTVK